MKAPTNGMWGYILMLGRSCQLGLRLGGVSGRSETELRRQTAMQGSVRFYEEMGTESPKNEMKAGGMFNCK